jgi:phosphatidate cytidylyltransferase
LERSLPAGRNFAQRVISALVFVPLILLVTYIGGIAFILLVEVLILASLAELWGILESAGQRPMRMTGYVLATFACLFTAYHSSEPRMIVAGFSITVLLSLLILGGARFASGTRGNLLPTMGGVLYIGWLFSHQIPLRCDAARLLPGAPQDADMTGWLLLLYGYSLVWTCDTSAYFIGRKFGVRRLVPRISPGKTVAGALGGFLCTVLVSLLYRHLFLSALPLHMALLLGAIIGVIAQAGDIFESALKRRGGVKDASSLIPGHGGLLDRFDGVLFALPAIYYILLAGVGP